MSSVKQLSDEGRLAVCWGRRGRSWRRRGPLNRDIQDGWAVVRRGLVRELGDSLPIKRHRISKLGVV